MATEKPYILPQGQQLTSEIITNLYLYAQPTTPIDDELLSSDLIRPILNLENIPNTAETISDIPQDIELVNAYVDAEPYIASGAGRFANGSQFDLIRAFFGFGKDQLLTERGRNNLVEGVDLDPGTYTKDDIDDLLFQGDEVGKGLGSFSSSIELRNYRDTLNDYDELVYIWNSSAFSISDNAEFVVNPDKTREIRNFRIEPNAFPRLSDQENFDFETANPVVETGSGLILEPRVDPSGIGRIVYIDFYNRGNLPIYDPVDDNQSAGIYNLIDFNADLARERLFFQPNFFGVIEPVKREAQRLFDAGVTRFLYQNKPIIYGSDGQDIFVPIEINGITYPYQSEYDNNGYVFIGGEDIDFIPGGFNDDILIGNEENDVITGDAPTTSLIGGDDTLDGGEGNDTLDGSVGEDIAIFSGKFEDYDYSISEDGETITFNHVRGTQTDGIDTLRNIEFAEFQGNQLEPLPINAANTEPGIISQVAAATGDAPRIIPLPLEDGVEQTQYTQARDITTNPNTNDLPTPPYLSLTAPVSMLDGDIDYTLNISYMMKILEKTINLTR